MLDAADPNESNALAALVPRIVAGEVAALEALYDTCCARVFEHASRLLGGHLEAVEQTVEEVFWQVWRQAPRLLAPEPAACAQAVRDSLNQLTSAAAGEAAVRHGLPRVSFAPSPRPGAARLAPATPPPTEQTA